MTKAFGITESGESQTAARYIIEQNVVEKVNKSRFKTRRRTSGMTFWTLMRTVLRTSLEVLKTKETLSTAPVSGFFALSPDFGTVWMDILVTLILCVLTLMEKTFLDQSKSLFFFFVRKSPLNSLCRPFKIVTIQWAAESLKWPSRNTLHVMDSPEFTFHWAEIEIFVLRT